MLNARLLVLSPSIMELLSCQPKRLINERTPSVHNDRLIHLECSSRTEPLIRIPLRQAVIETAALAVIHRIKVQRELRFQGSPLCNQVLLITFQIHVGPAQGRTMLFRYIHRLLDRQPRPAPATGHTHLGRRQPSVLSFFMDSNSLRIMYLILLISFYYFDRICRHAS